MAAFADIDSALVELRTRTEEARLQNALVAKSSTAYTLSAQQLSAGQIEMQTLLDVQRAYFDALDGQHQANLNKFRAGISLARALAGGWVASEGEKPACAWTGERCRPDGKERTE